MRPPLAGQGFRAFRCLVFWLGAFLSVMMIGAIAYGWFYNRPITDELPARTICAHEANTLSGWGQALRARFAKAVGPHRVVRQKSNALAPTNVVRQAIDRAETMSATQRKRRLEAQRFADGIETSIE